MLYPLKFNPPYKEYIWGGRRLEKLGRILPEGKIGEAWEVSCHPNGVSIISNGRFQGLSLHALIDKYPLDVLGFDVYEKSNKYFPLLFKLIDANDWLSVQVHPDDNYARIHENGSLGKYEAWYIIDAKPNSKIIYGVLPGIDKESFINAVNTNRIDACLNYIDVSAGDMIEIPPGTVHAIGEGIVLAEIQQNSNITYRIYDYNRLDKNGLQRELHMDKALDVINFDADPQRTKVKQISNRYFSLELLRISEQHQGNTEKVKFYIFFFIEGEASIEYFEGHIKAYPNETILIPASLGEYKIRGNCKALKTYVT